MSVTATKDPNNYYWILSENRFMYVPTRTRCERLPVLRQLGKECTAIVERDRVCSNFTWIPGADAVIKDKAINEGEIDDFPGNNLFNLYKPPKPLREDADPAKAKFWIDLGEKQFGEDLPHLLDCFAFKVQHPAIKINHAPVIGSYDQGIGKDAFISGLKRSVGYSNWKTKGARAVLKNIDDNFIPFLRSIILQISEVHEMGEKRFNFYDSIKDWCAAPPDMLILANKNVAEYPILNAVLPIFTTNHLTDGLYIPPQDRRIFYVWSQCRQSDFTQEYWRDYWNRLQRGEDEHIAAFLKARDVSKFDPGEPPRKTAAWHEAVTANRDPGDAELSDLLDALGHDWSATTGDLVAMPPAITLEQLRRHRRCPNSLHTLFSEPTKRRTATHRLASARYGSFPNPDRKTDGLWKINGRAQTVYVWSEMMARDKTAAVEELIRFEQHAPAPESAEDDFHG